MSGRTRISGPLLGCVLAMASARADAHPLVDEGRRLLDAADFGAAQEAFARAEAATDLDRDALIALLESRALLSRALGDAAALDADLERLAALDPEHAFAPGAPPDLRERFLLVRTRITGPLRLEVTTAPAPGGLAVRARVPEDRAGLVRSVDVSARVGEGPWLRGAGALTVRAAPGATVWSWAEARGPGGAVLVRSGSPEAPVASVVPGAPVARPAPVRARVAVRRSTGSFPWVWVGVGAVAVAAAITAGVLVASASSDDTVVRAPEL